MSSSAPLAGAADGPPGRVTVTRRALERTFTALAAEELGVAPGEVRVRVADDRGRLAVAVTGAAALPAGVSALALGGTVRSRIGGDGAALCGATLAGVDVRLHSLRRRDERRVR